MTSMTYLRYKSLKKIFETDFYLDFFASNIINVNIG